MARVKPESVERFSSTAQVDEAFAEMCELQGQLDKIDLAAEQKINAIKQKAAKEAEDIRERMTKLENSIQAFAEFEKKRLFPKEKKSLELVFGKFGFRQSSSISAGVKTLAALKEKAMTHFIKVKETPDKNALGSLTDEELKAIHAKRVVKDTFFYELKETAVTQHAARESA